MTQRNRIFAAVLLLYLALVALALYQAVIGIDPRYRESAEESLVETSALLATLIESDLQNGQINPKRTQALFEALSARPVSADIFGVHKDRIDLRCYVTDATGTVLYDSRGLAQGQNYAQWRDIYLALRGRYGSRTSVDTPELTHSSVMYVASALRHHDQIVGVVSVGKPVSSFEQFAATARRNILSTGLLAAGAGLALAMLVSAWLIKPFGFLADIWRHVHQARQQRAFSWRRLGQRTALGLRQSLSDIRDTWRGRNMVAEHVQTLTHEIKSPLSAIRAAAELLQEPLPAEQHKRFVEHVLQGAQRIQETVDRMMELTTLQSRHTLEQAQKLDWCDLVQQACDAANARAHSQAAHLRLSLDAPQAWVLGDAYLLRRAMANLIDNAIDFSPCEANVNLRVYLSTSAQGDSVCLQVQDQGPGIPDYALTRVFERYYSLPRPHGGRKSTGLGLPFVLAVAKLHGGDCQLENAAPNGCMATLSIPLLSSTLS